VGDCVEVTFRNQRINGSSSFHVAKLDRTVESSGVDVGFNPEQVVGVGGQRLYRYYVDKDVGSATIADFGDIRSSGAQGLYGAVVTAARGSAFTDPATGAANDIGAQVVVNPPGVKDSYRDVTLLFSDNDAVIGQNSMPYPTKVEGPAEINYRKAGPFTDDANMFSSLSHGGDPATPLVRAYTGDPIHFHVIGTPGSEQGHNLTLGGLSWNLDPHIDHSDEVQNEGFGPWESLDVNVVGGAGGRGQVAGDFAYGDLRRPFTQAGMWGLIRVIAPTDLKPDLLPLGG
jgi:manganese oxidase